MIRAHAVADGQHAVCLSAGFLSADRDEVRSTRDRNPARAGAGVEMDKRTDVVGSTHDFVDGLDRADLVVREPDRYQGDAGGDCVRISPGGCVDLGDGHAMTFSLKAASWSED